MNYLQNNIDFSILSGAGQKYRSKSLIYLIVIW